MIVQDDCNTVEANFLDLFAYILVIKSNRFCSFSNFTHHKLSFGLFPFFFSFYVQISISFRDFTLRTVFLLDFFPSFLHFMSKFLFLFVILRSVQSFFWTFFFFLLNISPIFYCFSINRVDLITKFGHITFTYR